MSTYINIVPGIDPIFEKKQIEKERKEIEKRKPVVTKSNIDDITNEEDEEPQEENDG